MAFSWAGAAGGAQGALRQQQQDALAAAQQQAQLEEMLALRHYRNQQVEAEKQRMDFARQQFDVQQAQREQEASDQRNQRGLMMMAGDIADQYPDDPRKMVGTLIRAGQNVPAALLAPPQGAEPFTLGPGQLRFDASGQKVAEGLPPTAETPGPFTLSPGQIRFDAQGARVAAGPAPQGAAGDFITMQSPDGKQQRQVTKGAQANDLLNQGWRQFDPVAARQANQTSPDEAADTAREVQRIAKALRNHPGLPGAFGSLGARMPTFRQNTADAETLLKSLQGLLTLENTGKLKGVLSNADMEVLRRASTTLAAEMSESAARAELDRLMKISIPGEAPANNGGGGGGSELMWDPVKKQWVTQ